MRRNQSTTRIRGLRMEQLETRRLLAGNVSVSRQGDTLLVRGDNLANEIEIFSAGGNSFTVAGFDTTVNGAEERTFSNIRNLNIDLRGGNDILSIADDPTGLLDLADAAIDGFPIDLGDLGPSDQTGIAGFIIIRTGAGADEVGLSVDVGQFVDIATGAGNDEVAVLASDINAHLFIRTEDGSDGVAVLDSFVNTTLLIEGGRGADGLFVQTFDGAFVTVNGGRDGDDIELFDLAVDHNIVLLGDQGNDDIELEFAEARFVNIVGGDGNDFIDADGVETRGDLIISAGNGNDDVEVEPNDEYLEEGQEITAIGGALVIDGGGGHDSLEAELVRARSITMIGAGGNDDLNVDGVNVSSFVIALGGAGNNFVDVGSSDDEEFDPEVGSFIGGFLQIITAGGSDEVFVNDVSVGQHILIDLGAGRDFLDLSFVEADNFLLILMGSGNDSLTYSSVSTGGDQTLDGGPGFDELLIDTRNGRRIRNFEDIEILD